MGYIGLLLNAPYKIDSMMEMRLMRMSFLLTLFSLFFVGFCGLSKPENKIGVGALKCM
jgi:hypothetical protein